MNALIEERKGTSPFRGRQAGRSEEEVFVEVQSAIQRLIEHGQSITISRVAREIGISRKTLSTYPRVKALFEQRASRYHVYQRRGTQPAEEELAPKVEGAIAELVSLGEPITRRTLARKVKISPAVLMQYPRVVVLLEQYEHQKRQQGSAREEEFFSWVLQAIQTCRASGQPRSQRRV